MPKLSEPQKQVLRTMYRHNWTIEIYAQDGHILMVNPGYWHPGWEFRPVRRTLEVLEREQCLTRVPDNTRKGFGHFEYHLTPKGREIAKELQDA